MSNSPDTNANDPLADAVTALLRAWARRSTAERSAFLSGLADAGPESDRTALRKLRERAALSGAVGPQDLARTQPTEDAARLLDLTSSDFDRTPTPDGWRWTLRFGARQEALSRLVADGRVADTLEAIEHLRTDRPGELLREIAGQRIAGELPTIPPTAATSDAVQALSWARPLGGVAAELAETRRRSEVAAVQEAYALLLSRGVIGRDRELAQLRAVAEAPTDPTAATPPLACVVGVGGAGKSTVIAELIRPYLDRLATPCASNPIVVVIDFDRVRFHGDAQLELSYEVSRQLGWAVPEAGADFSVLRYQQRKQRSESLQDTYSGSSSLPESDVRDSHAFDSEAGLLVDLHGLTTRPVLLVLDTFEEWQSRRINPFTSDRTGWNDPETRVWSWVAALHDQIRLRGLRVVVSGRADASLAGRFGAAPLEVPLDDLDLADTVRLLEALDVPADGRAELAKLAGGNPLQLLVAARFFRQLPAAEQRAFLDGGAEAMEGYTAELRSSVLYDRFLNHVPAQLRTLAHPGLVLRRVTPTLVREVLAPHCGLAGISVEEAENLTDQLADQVWLVKRTNTGLTHQPNVRRRMLQLMRNDPRLADSIRAINLAAAAWWGRPADGGPRREQELSPADADTEWFYHSLMVDPSGWERRLADPAERPRWATLATALRSSVEDMPDALRALLLYVRNDELTPHDVLTLPGAIAQDWVIRHGENLIKQGRATEALLLVASSKLRVPELPWTAQAYCEAGRWSGYWPVTEAPELPNADPRRILWQTGRYAAINAICSDEPIHWVNYRQRLAMLPELAQPTVMMPAELVERAFLALLASTSPAGVTAPAGNPSLAPLPSLNIPSLVRVALTREGVGADGPELFPVDQFRRMLVWLAGPPETPFGLRKITGLLRPDRGWVRRFGTLIGLSDGQIAEQVAYLGDWADRTKKASRPSIDMVLGEINLRLVRLVSDQIDVSPDVVSDAVRRDASLLDALRGDNPELRPAITNALIEATRPDGPHLLAELAQSVLPIPVIDLEPQNLPPAGDPRVRAILTQLVHVVDRSGVLMPFLTAAAERLPGAEPVLQVLRAARAWDAVHERLFTALAASLAQRPGAPGAVDPRPSKRLIRILTDLHHGDHALIGEAAAPPAELRAGHAPEGTQPVAPPRLAEVIRDAAPPSLDEISTPFGYLFSDLAASYPARHLPVEPAPAVVAALKALGSAMVDAPPDAEPNSVIPPVYTYWGQFVDHDITANTDRDGDVSVTTDPLTPIEPTFVTAIVRNLREPALNLDSVYGNGPGAPDVDAEVPYNGIKFRIGDLTQVTIPGQVAVPGADLFRTVASASGSKPGGKARIGDSRNDENLIVAQLHLAFLEFHNAVVDWLVVNETELPDEARFERARQLTRWHYQAITVNDFLRTVAQSAVVDDVLANPASAEVTTAQGEVFMPLEHSVAAYRFGHSMVRAQYDHNENFGRNQDGTENLDADGQPVRATFAQMFQFTGNGVIHVPPLLGQPFALPTFPDNWPIRWTRFTDKTSPFADRFTRKIDTHLAPPLTDLSNEGKNPDGSDIADVRVRRILKRLAVRNLLRGYRLALPTGQAIADALGATPLTAAELTQGDQGVADALVDGDLVDATPLWFYVLKEAEVRAQGQHLGEVGSRIVCTTLVGQIQADPDSYLNRPGGAWTTAEGVKLPGGGQVDSIRAFLEFAGVQI